MTQEQAKPSTDDAALPAASARAPKRVSAKVAGPIKNPETPPALKRWTHDAVADLLVSRTALTEIDRASALSIVTRMSAHTIPAGEAVFREGALDSNYLVLILSGEAIVENNYGGQNDAMVLGLAGPGHIVGEMGVIDREPRSATVMAVTQLQVATLDAQALSDAIAADPRAGCAFLAALLRRTAQRLRAANKKLKTNTAIKRALDKELDAVNSVLDREMRARKAAFRALNEPRADQVFIPDHS